MHLPPKIIVDFDYCYSKQAQRQAVKSMVACLGKAGVGYGGGDPPVGCRAVSGPAYK